MVLSERKSRLPIGYVVQESGCWDWIGSRDIGGYGRIMINRVSRPAHRYVWELANGKVPLGLELDHLCRNRACVRPDHLEPVTHKVNCLRGAGLGAINSKKTHCPHGHPYTAANTYRYARGARFCRTCTKAGVKKYQQRVGRYGRRKEQSSPKDSK